MSSSTSSATGEGEIDNLFDITRRGRVLVIRNGFRGTIRSNGVVESDRGAASYKGPEFLDGKDETGLRCAWLAVIVSDDAKELFAIGQSVRFYDRR